jgi:hypothetical protein
MPTTLTLTPTDADAIKIGAWMAEAADHARAFAEWCKGWRARQGKIPVEDGSWWGEFGWADSAPDELAGIPWLFGITILDVEMNIDPGANAAAEDYRRRIAKPFDPAEAEVNPRRAWLDLAVILDHCRDLLLAAAKKYADGETGSFFADSIGDIKGVVWALDFATACWPGFLIVGEWHEACDRLELRLAAAEGGAT